MIERSFLTRRGAVRAAFREMRRHLDEADTICVKVYLSLGELTVFEMQGRTKTLLGRFLWRAR